MRKRILFVFIIVILTFIYLPSDEIKGYINPEYYVNLSSQEGSIQYGQHGFWLKRIYLGYNTKLSDKLSARVRFEMNGKAFSEDKMVPYVKNAHLKYKVNPEMSLSLGIIEPPSFNKVEKFWGYRYVEKVSPDLFKMASSRDFGISLDGKFGGNFIYSLMYGNYSSNKGEDNKGKAIYGRIGFDTKNFYGEFNGHFARDGGKDIKFFNVFAGLRNDLGRVGGGFSYRSDKKEGSDKKDFSTIYVLAALKFNDRMEFYSRYDHLGDKAFKNITSYYLPIMAKDYKARVLMGGVNIKLHKMVELNPNIKYVFYSGAGHPDGDLWFNISMKISFKSKF